MTLKEVLENKIDVKGGRFTYGQRIDLFELKVDKDDEFAIARQLLKIFHDYDLKPADLYNKELGEYFMEIQDGLLHWIEAEKKLKYEPSEEEKRAGIRELFEALGHSATVVSLAKTHGTNPNSILEWEYAEVFLILLNDMETAKFNKRFNKVLDDKYNKK